MEAGAGDAMIAENIRVIERDVAAVAFKRDEYNKYE